jgi:endonuclease YncB( thermonuclease family)
VGLEMIKAGLATVYEAKTGAEFGKLEAKYREAEQRAQVKKIGMWAIEKKNFESPRDYKVRMAAIPEATATKPTMLSRVKFWNGS